MDLEKTAQGVTNMSYYSKKLYPFIEELIRNHNIDSGRSIYDLSVNDLELKEQYEFVRHIIINSKDELSCLLDNEDYSDIYEALLTLLFNANTESKIEFSEIIMEKVVNFYKDKMQSMIDDVIGWVQQEDMEDAGYINIKHKDNGESRWVRKSI